jgi:hypothetical protein
MTNNKVKKTALDRKLDKIRAAEESGKLGTKLTNRTLRKLTSNKLAVIGVLLFVAICVLCFGAPMFTEFSPTAIDLRAKMSPPDIKHILGTDQMGRDIWARILYGGRISIIVGLGSALGAALLGVTLAGLAVFPILGDGVEAVLDGQPEEFVGHTLDDLCAAAVAHGHEQVNEADGGKAAQLGSFLDEHDLLAAACSFYRCGYAGNTTAGYGDIIFDGFYVVHTVSSK